MQKVAKRERERERERESKNGELNTQEKAEFAFTNTQNSNSQEKVEFSNTQSANSQNSRFDTKNSSKNIENSSENFQNSSTNSKFSNPKNLQVLKGLKYKKFYGKTLFKDTFIEVDFESKKITYAPLDDSFKEGDYPTQQRQSKGFIIHRHTTTNFNSKENFVCLLAVDRLLSKGYEARHIIIEPTFKVGHNQQVYGDILVLDKTYKPLCLIENKTYGAEFEKEWKNMQENGGQLFSYYAVNKTPYLCLLAYDFEVVLNKIIYKSHIITTLDNQKHLDLLNANITDKEKQKLAFSDSQNANAKDYFKVWNESYSLSYTTKGLLESSIAPYSVGKEKYTKDDLEVVPYSEIASIYHAFATILRNNAISNYESTFYVLVDLFLCKIIDEKQNAQDLQFYYKGVAYDSPFDYIDRLLSLYERGIDTLFKKKVVNVSKGEIDRLFTQAKRHKGKFKDEIQSIFDRQKYFNIKKFNFIEVENEEEFFINFKVLIQITNLIQDFYITQSENNQFLGDLFEGFLNRSVHQTEGRFFTPTPITNFIIYSLPHLANQPKVLDFACGAGHFLTEFIAHNKNAKLYGIEKNKDLSKVAKTACVLHNTNEANIIFQDALDNIKERYAQDFEKASFDLILSNPPYSVKGFLSTLTQKVLDNFELSQSIDTKSYETNGAIECFFIERAKHFLKENGLLALVLPVSILQKAQIYEKTRELLFKHFKILALVEMNSRTFGSTGTQTIILFAKRVEKYANDLIGALKNANFNDENISQDFKESHFLKTYCEFMSYDESDFKAFMSGEKPTLNLQESEVFKEYFSDFNANKPKIFKPQSLKESDKKALFEKSKLFTLNLTPKESKQAFNDFEKSAEFKELQKDFIFKQFLEQIRLLEQEKMLYYTFIYDEKILILKSPSDKNAQNKSNKANIVKFLGYDWSKRKGDEGIKYQTATLENDELKESKDDSDEEKKSKEALRNINSIKHINTPLYNPSDLNDLSKLNTAVREFIILQELKQSNSLQKTQSKELLDKEQEVLTLLEGLQPYEVDYYSIFTNDLVDMIDFKRAEFNKAISLNSSTLQNGSNVSTANPFANSKFELVKLGDFIKEQAKSKIQVQNAKENTTGKYPFFTSGTNIYCFDTALISGKNIFLSTGGNAIVQFYEGESAYSTDTYTITSKDENEILTKFIFLLLQSITPLINEFYFKGMGLKHLQKGDFKNIQLPKPPREIQLKIIAECEEIDKKEQNIKSIIKACRECINAILIKCGVINSQEIPNLENYFSTLETLTQTLSNFKFSDFDKENLGLNEFNKATEFNKANSNQGIEFNKADLNSSKEVSKENLKLNLNTLKALIKALPTPPAQGWERVKLGDLGEIRMCKRIMKHETNSSSGVPFYKIGTFGGKADAYIPQELYENYKARFSYPKTGQVLISAAGTLGKAVVYDGEPAYFQDSNIVWLDADENKVLNKFLFIIYQTIEWRSVAGTKGGIIERIYNENLRKVQIPLPKEISTQEKIIKPIEWLESAILALNATTDNLAPQKAKILQKYLF